jgi:hypothetical protein
MIGKANDQPRALPLIAPRRADELLSSCYSRRLLHALAAPIPSPDTLVSTRSALDQDDRAIRREANGSRSGESVPRHAVRKHLTAISYGVGIRK